MVYNIYHKESERIMSIYKSKEIQKLAGASKIQLVHWINIGAIEPYEDDRRRGGVRKFNQQNLIEACICKKLNDLRIPAHAIATALEYLREPISPKEKIIFWDIFKKTYKKKKWYLMLKPSSETKYYDKLVNTEVANIVKKDTGKNLEDLFFTAYVSKNELHKYLDMGAVAIIVDLNKIAEKAGGV